MDTKYGQSRRDKFQQAKSRRYTFQQYNSVLILQMHSSWDFYGTEQDAFYAFYRRHGYESAGWRGAGEGTGWSAGAE